MITAYGSVEVAVQALKRGANDYFSKPWDNEKLLIEIANMISKHRLERENAELKRALKQRYSFPNIVGKSERMQRILDLVAQVASSRATILITGETGTGKELIAHAIHSYSARSEHPFVPVHSGSVPADLLESALFGHVRGAFTGAMSARKGYFEVANHGTLFFDEIGTISLETQTKLLRVIQEREFMPLGSAETVKVDVRIVAATNADLKKLVEEGKFREDLYYRLNVINLALPPLRERKEDIPALVQHFFTKYCRENEKFLDDHNDSILRFEPDAMQVLMDHGWPGNVRELENAIERAVVLTEEGELTAAHFPTLRKVREAAPAEAPSATGVAIPGSTLAALEKEAILRTLEACAGSTSRAAEILDISPRKIQYKLKEYQQEGPLASRKD
jgi:DNA-binding NtrC family response regulator